MQLKINFLIFFNQNICCVCSKEPSHMNEFWQVVVKIWTSRSKSGTYPLDRIFSSPEPLAHGELL